VVLQIKRWERRQKEKRAPKNLGHALLSRIFLSLDLPSCRIFPPLFVPGKRNALLNQKPCSGKTEIMREKRGRKKKKKKRQKESAYSAGYLNYD
jgi:hypothetical protein